MKKELDAFSLDFVVELPDYPKMNTFPSRKGKSEMFCFPSGYYSFDEEGKMDGCHLYVQDYQGNNRMAVNAYTDEVEQINHYYPYGALMADISTQPEKQDFKYSGKVLAAKRKIDNLSARRRALARVDRTYGLDRYDFHARQFDLGVPMFDRPDPMAEKYYGISPYAYCAGDPVNYVDLHGDTLTVNGEQSQAAMDQLQAAAGESIALTRNTVSGTVSYEQKDPNKKLRGKAKKIARIIDNKSITVNVNTTSSTNTPDNSFFLGGAFLDNVVDAKNKTVVAFQLINTTILGKIDKANTSGTTILHEVTEAYIGAKISRRKGVSSPAAGQNGSVYERAHRRASYQPPVYQHLYDYLGKEIKESQGAAKAVFCVFDPQKKEVEVYTLK